MSDRSITPFGVVASETLNNKPSREAAEAAVKTLIRWIGDDPEREGLRETPQRVIKALDELYNGYDADIQTLMLRTFSETENYDEFVLVRDIAFVSHCEHHMLPFKGTANIAYFPKDSVIGLSKLARLTEAFGRRLQTQEKLTSQIFYAIENFLDPRGIAIAIQAEHSCMSMRGVKSHGSSTFTSRFSGLFLDPLYKDRFYRLIETK